MEYKGDRGFFPPLRFLDQKPRDAQSFVCLTK